MSETDVPVTDNVRELRPRAPETTPQPAIELACADDTLILLGASTVPVPGDLVIPVGLFCGISWPEEGTGSAQRITMESPVVQGLPPLAERIRRAMETMGVGPSDFGVGLVLRHSDQSIVRARWALNVRIFSVETKSVIGRTYPVDVLTLLTPVSLNWPVTDLSVFAEARAHA